MSHTLLAIFLDPILTSIQLKLKMSSKGNNLFSLQATIKIKTYKSRIACSLLKSSGRPFKANVPKKSIYEVLVRDHRLDDIHAN